MTWATRITLGRLVCVPLFLICVVTYDDSRERGQPDETWRWAALTVFLFAAASDALDGYLARHCHQQSALGALLDPIADKLLLLAALVSLGVWPLDHRWTFPLWFPVLIISRDAVLLLGYLILRHFRIKVEIVPHWSGKLSTFFTFLAITSVLLKLGSVTFALCCLGGGLAVIGTLIYVRQGLRLLQQAGQTSASTRVARP